MIYDYKTGVYTTVVNKDIANNMYYLYKIHFKDIDVDGKIYERVTYAVDPYANSVSVNGDKGFILDINDNITKPYGFKKHSIPEFKINLI